MALLNTIKNTLSKSPVTVIGGAIKNAAGSVADAYGDLTKGAINTVTGSSPARPPTTAMQGALSSAAISAPKVTTPTAPILASTPNPNRPPSTTAPSLPPAPSTSQAMATLIGPTGDKVAVPVGSSQAQNYFGKGYKLPGPTPAAPNTTTTAPPIMNQTPIGSTTPEVTPPPTTTPTTTPTETPVTDTKPDFAAQLKALQDAYTKTMQTSPEELGVTQSLGNLAREQADIEQSARLGDENIREQAIPMGLLTGQSAALQRQLTNKLTGVEAKTVPLKTQLALLQAKRASASDVAKSNLDFATNAQKAASEQARAEQERKDALIKPIEVGGSLLRFNPDTGKYETQYTAPSKASEGYTLGAGEQRYDAQGNLVASGGTKPGSAGDYDIVQDQQTGAFFRINKLTGQSEPITTGGGPLGIDGVSGSTFSTGLKQAGPVSAEQQKLQANVQSGLESLKVLTDAESSFWNKSLPLGLGRQTLIGNGTYEAAKANLVDIIGRLRSGGAISADEGKRFESLLPSATDKDATAKYKLEQIGSLLQSLQQKSTASPSQNQQADPLSLGFNSESQTSLNGGFDQRTEKLAAAIKQHESGGNYNAKGASTEGGAYQFMPATWKEWAGKYLGNPNAPQTPQNQDIVAKSKISDLLNQGYNEQQVALIWNGGEPKVKSGVNKYGVPYDTGKYANNVLSIYKKLG